MNFPLYTEIFHRFSLCFSRVTNSAKIQYVFTQLSVLVLRIFKQFSSFHRNVLWNWPLSSNNLHCPESTVIVGKSPHKRVIAVTRPLNAHDVQLKTPKIQQVREKRTMKKEPFYGIMKKSIEGDFYRKRMLTHPGRRKRDLKWQNLDAVNGKVIDS